jgi:hypothetical protein
VNTGNRTPKQDAEAQEALVSEAVLAGAEFGEEGGEKFVVTKAFGLTVKTRV